MLETRFREVALFTCFVVVLCLSGVSLAGAATVTHSATVPLAITNWTNSVSIPKFDPALGTLNSVAFALDGHVEGDVMFESLDAAPATVTSTLSAVITLKRPDNSAIVATTPAWATSDNVSVFDGVIDFGGTSGKTYSARTADGSNSSTSPPPPGDLALFTGVGNISLPVTAAGATSATGAGNLVVSFTTRASADVKVVYTYTPPPRPHIDIIKYTNGEDANTPTGPVVAVGSTVTWTYVVTNDGNVDLTNVQVTDDKLGPVCVIGPLAVGATSTCTMTGIAQAGQYANLGTVTGNYGQIVVTDADPSHYFAEEQTCVWTKDPFGYFVVDMGKLKPIVDGCPAYFCIPVAYTGLFDSNGNKVLDPATGCQKMEYDWTNSDFMCRPTDAYFVQSVTLEKIHSMRKGACALLWENDYIRQQGKELATSEINLCWPLLYETHGTKWVLSIVYQTNPAKPNPEGRSVRVHKERYVWTVDWDAADFSEFRARLDYFSKMPAGQCELFAVPQTQRREMLWLLDSKGCREWNTYDPGITELLRTSPSDPMYQQNLQKAADKAVQLEGLIDAASCVDPCRAADGLPIPGAIGIVNNNWVPAGSVLLTDFYYAAHAAGLLTD
jgi:hypothetical protein